MSTRAISVGGVVALVVALLLGTLSVGASTAPTSKRGGALTVVVVDQQYLNADPAHDHDDVTDESFMNAIFGGLFFQRSGGRVGLGMASSYAFSEGNRTLTITLRSGLRFSDGTPLNAAAVAFNINRDLSPANDCDCASSFATVRSVSAVHGDVVLQLSEPDLPILQAFINNAPDWPASPRAIEHESEAAFELDPIGAGPFLVQSFVPDTRVALVRNPHYYQRGRPNLDALTFITASSDEQAIEDLQAGEAQMALGVTTGPLIIQERSQYRVVTVDSTQTTDVELNALDNPFGSELAREAIAYATDPSALLATTSPGLGETVEAEQGPGGLFFERTVAGFRSDDLAKAKALVARLGSLSFNLQTVANPTDELLAANFENELAQAGIQVVVTAEPLTVEEANLAAGDWQAVVGSTGGTDPDVGSNSVVARFASWGSYTCCHDSTLDSLINKSIAASSNSIRQSMMDEIYSYITKKQYALELYSIPSSVIIAPSLRDVTVVGEGGSLTAVIDWQDVSI